MPAFADAVLIGICTLIYVLDGLIHSILGPLAPDMARDLGLTKAQLGPIFSANLLGQCIGLVLLPLLAAAWAIVVSCCCRCSGFGIGTERDGTGRTVLPRFRWRLLTGVFLGGCLPSCLAMVTARCTGERRGLAIMVLFMGYGLGATVAGLLASAFLQAGGWRAAMVAAGAACLVTAALAWRHLSCRPARSRTGKSKHGSPNRSYGRGRSSRHVICWGRSCCGRCSSRC